MSELWYRLNMIGEKKFFEDSNLVDGIVVPAHLLSFYHGALPNFLRDIDIPFIIDPMTYVWNMWNVNENIIIKENELKKSYQKYLEKLDHPIASLLGNVILSQAGMVNSEYESFIERILHFQYTLGGHSSDPRIRSLQRIRRMTRGTENEEIRPSLIIPPYFYSESINDFGYNYTKRAAEYANTLPYSELSTISPCICINPEVIESETDRGSIINDFSDYHNIILWLNDFDEREVGIHSLSNLKEFVEGFHENDISIMNFYGTYYSLLLDNYGLNSLSSGIAISHRKNIFLAATGGGMPLRYYEPSLKMEILNDSAHRLYSRHPDLFDCDCPICAPYSNTINNLRTRDERENFLAPLYLDLKNARGQVVRPAIMNWENTRNHFLYAKKKEQRLINTSTFSDVLSELQKDYQYLSSRIDYNYYNFNSSEHLDRWYRSLT